MSIDRREATSLRGSSQFLAGSACRAATSRSAWSGRNGPPHTAVAPLYAALLVAARRVPPHGDVAPCNKMRGARNSAPQRLSLDTLHALCHTLGEMRSRIKTDAPAAARRQPRREAKMISRWNSRIAARPHPWLRCPFLLLVLALPSFAQALSPDETLLLDRARVIAAAPLDDFTVLGGTRWARDSHYR